MSLKVERMDARPRSDEQMDLLFADGWPKFITADQEVKKFIGRAREYFPALEIALLDEEDLVASGWAVPIRWTGDPLDLPTGYTDSLALAVVNHERGVQPDTLVVMAAQVRPDLRGKGLATELLIAMKRLAKESGLNRLVLPVRPTLKSQYPLTPIEQFATWIRPDGSPLDPWVRTHWRLGARIIATAPKSMTMTGAVQDWETWTGMVFPNSGQYAIPDGLDILSIDRERDLGVYYEPNIWMQHI
jgi:GNAT superfamily N-acetyltransferase